MSKKKEQRDNGRDARSVPKRKNKILRVKLGDFLTVSIYDLVTWVGIALSVGLVLIYGFQGNQRGVRWSIALLVLFVLIMLAIRAKQHFFSPATRKPELYISGSRMLPLEAGKPETVLLGLRNRGEATARNIRLGGGNHLFTIANFSGPLEYRDVESRVHADLGPGEENTLTSRSPDPLTAKEIRELQEGKMLFFHFAEGEYQDDFGAVYPIDFCYMYNPLSPTIMNICPEKYWPRERKDRKFPPRPRLVLESAGVNLVAGQNVDVHVAFTNDGDADIARMWIQGMTSLHPKTFLGPLSRKGMTKGELPVEMIAGRTITTTLREPQRWTEEGVQAIEGGDYLLFHFGRTDYVDPLGNSYWLEYCLRYDPGLPPTSSGLRYMGFADKRFWPTEDEDEDNGG